MREDWLSLPLHLANQYLKSKWHSDLRTGVNFTDPLSDHVFDNRSLNALRNDNCVTVADLLVKMDPVTIRRTPNFGLRSVEIVAKSLFNEWWRIVNNAAPSVQKTTCPNCNHDFVPVLRLESRYKNSGEPNK